MAYSQRGGDASKKEKTNEWTGVGIVTPRSGKAEDEIKFFPFTKTGGGVIHISLKCEEMLGADANGQPKIKTAYIPVNVMANKLITVQQLQSVRAGMKVKVVGKLEPETYDSRRTGTKVTTLVVNAYVFEILQLPMQQPVYPQPQQGYGPQQPQGGYPPYGGQAPYGGGQPVYPPPQGGYPAYGAQPVYPQGPQAPAYPPQPQQGYGPQQPQGGYPAYGGQPAPAPAAPAAPQGGTPLYYQPPQGAPAAPAAPAAVQQPGGAPIDPDDLPPA